MVLARYVLKEHIAPFVFGFSVIIFLLVVDLILVMLDRILGKGIPVSVVLELFFLNTAWMVALAVPMAVLVGTLMAFGRLSADGEITAMRASGVQLSQVVRPVLLAGLVLALFLLWFNDRVLPEFNHRARLLMMDITRKRPTVAFEDRSGMVIDDFAGYRLLFDRADAQGRMLAQVRVYHFDGEDYPVTIEADSGQVILGAEDAFLWLKKGALHRIDAKEKPVHVLTQFENAQLHLGDARQQLSRSSSTYRNDREMSIVMMQGRIAQNGDEIEKTYRDMAQEAATVFKGLLLGTGDQTDWPALRALMGRIQAQGRIMMHKKAESDRLRVEIHKKYSIAVACLAFVLVGVPLGIRARGRNPAVGASLSIGFFLMWWIFLIGGEKLADRGVVAPWLAMWAPNFVTLLIGGFMSVRVIFEHHLRRRISA